MFSGIQTLPSEVINLIAAGEVIDSLAAVVRELIENALDAGATKIVISLYPDLWRIQVADNGKGMTLTDLRNCASAHSTSKIRTCDDLWKITSLGFRGEALHSITQVADLEICSRVATETGWRVVYQQNTIVEETPIAIAPGTIVTVSNLFGNFPVRRRGLPTIVQQLKTVQLIIQQIALCHPQITWQVFQHGQLWFNISSAKTADQIIGQLLKRVHLSDLSLLCSEIPTPQDVEKASIPHFNSQIELIIGLPDRCHRHKPDWVKVAVNGRMIRSSELEQTIITGFSRTLPRDRYPICFLHLHISPHQIDWNRHPAKTEIYLHNLDFWREQINQAIEKILKISPSNLPRLENQRVSNLLKASEEKNNYQIPKQKVNTPSTPIAKNRDLGLLKLTAVAQVNNTYIVAEHEHGLWLIEQHIAHERVLYEQLQDVWELIDLASPIILNNLTESQLTQLQRIGLEIEEFGEQMWAIRKAPAMLAQRNDCTEALIELSWGGDLQEAQVAVACRSAIRNGKLLNLEQMQTLIEEWQKTRNPRTCPHGRPIFLSLEETALSRFFRRHWVIGKSHGI